MTLVKQPKRSRLCGQSVLAMILGMELSEAVRLVGHRKGTKAADLRRALDKRALRCSEVRLVGHHDIPQRAILRLSRPHGNNWHWMLMWDGEIFDPSTRYSELLAKGWRITSFMEVAQ